MENKVYSFELPMYYYSFDNFKQKQADMILALINGCAINKLLTFNGYGICTFEEDDVKKQFPKIEMQEKFNRMKTNCIVFNLPFNSKNDGLYTKCFIFTCNGKEGFYNYVFYNEKTKEVLYKYCIEQLYDNLCKHLKMTFNSFVTDRKLKFYKEKHDAVKVFAKTKVNNVPTVYDYEKSLEANKYILTQKYI